MGGGSGGYISGSDIERLENKAKEQLKKTATDSSRHVFISFSHNDLDEVNLLRGQSKNENTEFKFDDHSVKEPFNSSNADYIKRQIREKIDRCSVTVVYLSTNSSKSDWVNWEIEESIKRGKGVIGVYKGNTAPTTFPEAFSKHKCKSIQWTHEGLKNSIEEASQKRK